MSGGWGLVVRPRRPAHAGQKYINTSPAEPKKRGRKRRVETGAAREENLLPTTALALRTMAEFNEGFSVTLSPHSGRLLFICFCGLQHWLAMPVFEFRNILGKEFGDDVSTIFLRDTTRSWYHRGVQGLRSSAEETVGKLHAFIATS